MEKCPFFGLCGGCKFDFSAPEYKTEKIKSLHIPDKYGEPIWGVPGYRRRAEFTAAPGYFGFYKPESHDIINITNCPNVLPDINKILPDLSSLPWGGLASVLVTKCENGIVVNVTTDVPYFSPEFNAAVQKLPPQIIRFTWNKNIIRTTEKPFVKFDDVQVDFPDNAFLQPTADTEKKLRDMVSDAVMGEKRIADLFCGIGNFTFITHATGFDIMGIGTNRDLFKKPLNSAQLNKYDIVIMDPPRAGAMAQSTKLAKSNVKTVVYISCNPNTWERDKNILINGGYKLKTIIPVDQFVGSAHWEIFSVFKKS